MLFIRLFSPFSSSYPYNSRWLIAALVECDKPESHWNSDGNGNSNGNGAGTGTKGGGSSILGSGAGATGPVSMLQDQSAIGMAQRLMALEQAAAEAAEKQVCLLCVCVLCVRACVKLCTHFKVVDICVR